MKKRSITLLEIMIVILLIGLIGGVISYNLKGTLDKGKAFRSKEGAMKLQDILNLEIQIAHRKSDDFTGGTDEKYANVLECIKNSGLVTDPKNFVKDGWGEPYTIVPGEKNSVKVWSLRLKHYNTEHKIVEEDES